MAWRDRLRRRVPAEHSDGSGGGPAGDGTPGAGENPPGAVPGRTGRVGLSVPGDWDGGWRRVAAPRLTLSRAPLGVSDGLAFRAGLAAWQDPSFDSGLGHALLPAAPAGLVHGVTRPATAPATHSGGGPLLLRSALPEGEDSAAGDDPSAVGVLVEPGSSEPGRPAPGSRGSGADRGGLRDGGVWRGSSGEGGTRLSRGLAADGSSEPLALLSAASSAAVQRSAVSGPDPVVSAADAAGPWAVPATPLVRRVAVVPPGAGAGDRSGAGPNGVRTAPGRTPPGPGAGGDVPTSTTPTAPPIASNSPTGADPGGPSRPAGPRGGHGSAARAPQGGGTSSLAPVQRAAVEEPGPRSEGSSASGRRDPTGAAAPRPGTSRDPSGDFPRALSSAPPPPCRAPPPRGRAPLSGPARRGPA
ncbi:syndecan 1 [Streptomyces sp. SolWspMP-5a-2]|nr:syndecan 1 [Streptomyces sp. SolWspMP-5a-2]